MGITKLLNMSRFVSETFKPFQATMVIIMVIASLVMIVGVLVSPPQTGIGSNVITGASESYYTKNKGKSNQGRIKMLVIICASIIALCALLYFIAYAIYPGDLLED